MSPQRSRRSSIFTVSFCISTSSFSTFLGHTPTFRRHLHSVSSRSLLCFPFISSLLDFCNDSFHQSTFSLSSLCIAVLLYSTHLVDLQNIYKWRTSPRHLDQVLPQSNFSASFSHWPPEPLNSTHCVSSFSRSSTSTQFPASFSFFSLHSHRLMDPTFPPRPSSLYPLRLTRVQHNLYQQVSSEREICDHIIPNGSEMKM